MDEQEAEDFNDEVIRVLRKFAPWAVEHIEDSVRRGKAVAKRVARKGAKRTATIVEDTKPFGSSTFVETQDLTATEKLGITLDAVERLLIHPALIVEEIRKTLVEAELVGVAFAEPGDPKEQRELGEDVVLIPVHQREEVLALLNRVRAEISDV